MKVNLLVYISVVVSPSYLNASQNQLLHLRINAAITVLAPLYNCVEKRATHLPPGSGEYLQTGISELH